MATAILILFLIVGAIVERFIPGAQEFAVMGVLFISIGRLSAKGEDLRDEELKKIIDNLTVAWAYVVYIAVAVIFSGGLYLMAPNLLWLIVAHLVISFYFFNSSVIKYLTKGF